MDVSALTERELSVIRNAVALLTGKEPEIFECKRGPVSGWATSFYVTLKKTDPRYNNSRFTVVLSDRQDVVCIYIAHIDSREFWSSNVENNPRTPILNLKVKKWGMRRIELEK